MQFYFRDRTGCRPVGLAVLPEITEKVSHCRGPQELGRAERYAADCAQLLLELACHAGVHGEVTGIVRSRGELIDEQSAVASQKELDTKYADDIELFEHAERNLDRFVRELRWQVGGRDGQVQDVMTMGVGNHAPMRKRP